ncbi:MAG TPA: hypothetical protein VMZ28_20215 [Kofleriaceae bacterium]|nr:hypothetical protein [Kofleriaceae bacterium]
MSRRRLPLILAVLLFAACDGQPDDGRAGADAGPATDAGVSELDIDLFGVPGHEFRFIVSPEQAEAMQKGDGGGGEDMYQLGGGTFADDLVVTDVADGDTHSFGKVELTLIGESTFRPWERIPNLRVDMDEFQPGLRVGGVEHFRLNNGQVGGIYREAIAARLWRALGYPAPRSGFAWGKAPNQWTEPVRVPYTLMEVYKPGWCEESMPGCRNMWEAPGDIYALPGQCQFDLCEESRLTELISVLFALPYGAGYTAATADWVDWDAYRSFQCLSWISGTGDDYLHNTNNLVLVERDDGRFQLLPYSIDISAGQAWYSDVKLMGNSHLARACQWDPACWDALLDRCDEMLDEYDDLDVVGTIVEPTIAEVAAAGMERPGDDYRAEELVSWYGERADKLRDDPVWQWTPCQEDLDCEDDPDGNTECQGICVAPGSSCFDIGCPEGFWCDEFGECQPF